MAFKIESINPKKTAVLVIDMQNDFVTEGYPLYTPYILSILFVYLSRKLWHIMLKVVEA